MKIARLALTIALAILVRALSAAAPEIDQTRLLDHVKFLSSDELKGRANGSPELERAAEYVAAQFKSAGLTPAGAENSWFQPFDLDAGLRIGKGNALLVKAGGTTVSLDLATSYYPLSSPANDTPDVPSIRLSDVPLVFAGYGVTAPGLRYDDYANVDVRGKAVLVFSHEPQERLRNSRLNGNQPIPETSLYAKATAARRRGAVALLVVSDPAHDGDQANFANFAADPDADDLGIPVLRVRRNEMEPLLNTWGLDQLARLIDEDLRPRSQALTGAAIDYAEFITRNRRTVRNVIGTLPAAGARAHEAIVIGAHYDHVGLGGRYSSVPDRLGEVHNGADDNASGTAAIIEIARAAAADPTRFPRTLVFVAFTGEERGLLGSRYYAANPVIPVRDTLSMINLDMVGRFRGSVDVSGIDSAPSLLRDLNAAAQAAGNITFKQEGPGAGRSDDSPFLEVQVPAINFFTGFHGDYHRPSDDWERINPGGTARVARLALELAARIAARPDRPVFTPQRR
jgi:hypothetical protein